ncbi:MAG: type I DNA topoisomerase [Bacteroidales bacterium]|nr:type I DNA topoisomerase [Bacteroidales bacterium]
MAENLVIVESPSKAKTIEKYLGKGFKVKSSFGHIRDLEKNKLGIDIDNGFQPNYIIPEDKEKVVKELKKDVKDAKVIWLASDEDREGEAIAWHLKEALKLDKKETKRIVFNEITKNAILHAVENPREIDINLVNAQQARRVLDRIVGYEISPILWRKIKPALSAGRVQSVAVRLIVEREEEIKNFQTSESFKISALFLTPDNKSLLKATLNQKFSNKKEAEDFLSDCLSAEFKVDAIEMKPAKQTPPPPFTTSTLQQEASRKFGFSVQQTMTVAQQLYEEGLITYMRTDSVNLSDFALMQAKDVITDLYGKKYLKTRKFSTKTKGAQEAHEAIRPTQLSLQSLDTADRYKSRLYSLIWKRMIASQMAEAKLEKTNIEISISTNENKFLSQAEVLLFDGFLKLYSVSVDEEDEQEKEENIIPQIAQGDILNLKKCTAKQSFTTPPPRFNEATLVKKLEDLGIGRPSTYAPTISTIQKRDYVEKRSVDYKTRNIEFLSLENGLISSDTEIEKYGKETNKLAPTDIGIIVNNFLVNNFKDILDYNFTAEVEEHFDKIAQGKEDWHKMLRDFYMPFEKEVSFAKEHSEKQKGERLLGKDPKTNKNVYAKIGRYGAMIQIGENTDDEKPVFSSLRSNQSISTVTLQEALDLFSLPRNIGEYQNKEIIASTGRFGAYIKWGDVNVSLPKKADPYTISLDECIPLIDKKLKTDEIKKNLPKTLAMKDGKAIELKYGRFGLYLSFNEKNFRIPAGTDVSSLSEQDAIDIVEEKKKADTSGSALKVFSNGAELLKGRYGEYIKYNGKNFRLPKGLSQENLTEEDVNKIISK